MLNVTKMLKAACKTLHVDRFTLVIHSGGSLVQALFNVMVMPHLYKLNEWTLLPNFCCLCFWLLSHNLLTSETPYTCTTNNNDPTGKSGNMLPINTLFLGSLTQLSALSSPTRREGGLIQKKKRGKNLVLLCSLPSTRRQRVRELPDITQKHCKKYMYTTPHHLLMAAPLFMFMR